MSSRGLEFGGVFFVDLEHQANFAAMIEKFPQAKNDFQYRVACYTVSHPELYRKINWNKVSSPFDWYLEDYDGERNEQYQDVDLSSGFNSLANAGFHIFSGGRYDFDLDHALGHWGDGLFQMFVNMIAMRRKLI